MQILVTNNKMKFAKENLILEKGLLPKNPLDADKGLGWADDKIKCCLLVISFFLLIALLPHNKKTTGSVFSLIKEIILSVNISQPLPL